MYLVHLIFLRTSKKNYEKYFAIYIHMCVCVCVCVCISRIPVNLKYHITSQNDYITHEASKAT